MKLCLIITMYISFIPFIISNCDVSIRDDSQDAVYKDYKLSLKLIDSTIQRALSYRNVHSGFLSKNLIFYTKDFFVYIFENIECIKVPEIENLSYIANDISQFITINKNNNPQLVNVFVGLYRKNELTPQSFYYLYNQHTRQQIKVNNLQNTNDEIITNNTVFINNISSLKEHYDNNIKNGINVFLSNETAFNDFCFNFYDKQTNRDVVLADRRKYLYVPLCDENYTLLNVYIKKDFSEIKATCKSNIYNIMTSQLMLNRVNNSVDVFFENEVKIGSGLKTFTCAKTAFKSSQIAVNFAFWLVLIFIITQVVIIIIYFVTHFDMKYKKYLEFLDSKVKICVNEGDDNINNVNGFARRRSTIRTTQRRRSKMAKTLSKIDSFIIIINILQCLNIRMCISINILFFIISIINFR